MSTSIDFSSQLQTVQRTNPIRLDGKVCRVIGLVVESIGPQVSLGEICRLAT
jgi:flagellum-specific ATP synthase